MPVTLYMGTPKMQMGLCGSNTFGHMRGFVPSMSYYVPLSCLTQRPAPFPRPKPRMYSASFYLKFTIHIDIFEQPG